MRFLLAVFLLGLASSACCQTYRNSFDVIELQSYEGRGASFRTNASRTIHDIGSKFLLSYINMYETTKDKKYLDKFIIQAKRIHDVRDDEIVNTYNINNNLILFPEIIASNIDCGYTDIFNVHHKDIRSCSIADVSQRTPYPTPVWSAVGDRCGCMWTEQSIVNLGTI